MKRRGFMIWIFMVVLVLLGVFSLIAGRLMVSTFRVTRDSHEAQTQALRLDTLLSRLRADVWDAKQIDASPQRLALTRGDGQQVIWQVEKGQLRRTQDQDVEPWGELGANVTFARRGAMVLVKVDEGPVKRSDEVALLSQTLLAAREEK